MPMFLKKIGLLLAIVLFSVPAFGYDLARSVVKFELPNGMRWFYVKRAQAPVFSGVVMVKAGGADEEAGKTGLAHVFEHMAFKGSKRIGTRDWTNEKAILENIEEVGEKLTAESRRKDGDASLVESISKELAALEREADRYRSKNEVWEVLVRNGAADLNAYTSKDLTAYHASMPSNRLELWASVMAEMVFEPAFREFYTERSVIAEERRSGVDNNPDGLMSEKILSSSWESGPYRWSTIGFEDDVMGLTVKDARAFHRKHYVPNNMVGVLVGDLDPAAARAILGRTFGRYGRGRLPPAPAADAKSRGGSSEKFSFDAEPSLAVAWHKPTLPDPAEYSFDLLQSLLCDGRSSRLQKRLVYEKKLAEEIYCSTSYPGARLQNLFLVWVDPMKSADTDAIVREINEEIASLREMPVGEKELSRVKKQVASALVFSLDRNMQLALQIAQFETVFGDWRLLAEYPKRIAAVTAEELMQTAGKYLTDANRVLVERTKGKR